MEISSRLPSMAMYFVWYAARGISGFVVPLYLYSIGLPVVEVGIALGFSGAGVLIFEAVWGFVLDRIGAAKTLPGAEAVAVITFLLFRFVNTPVEAYAASFVLGMTAPVMIVIGRYLVVGESESSRWGAGFGILGAAIYLGSGIGALAGGIMSSKFGYGDAFYFAAFLAALSFPLFLLTRKKASAPQTEPAEKQPQAARGRSGPDWRTLSVLSVVAVPLFMGSYFYTNIMQLVVTQTSSIAASRADAAVMISLYSFSNVVFMPLLGAAFARRARSFIALGLALNFAVFLALTQTGGMLGFDTLAVAEAFCFSMVSPLSLSLLMVWTPRRYAGRMMGMYGAAEDVGIILGPVVGAFVWAGFGLQAAYLSMGVSMLAALAFYLLTLRQPGTG